MALTISQHTREYITQIFSLLGVLCSALIIWKSVSIYSNCQSPIVVVLTGSMEPAFYKGDILFLSLSSEPIHIGDIIVYKLESKEIPIVHRVIRLHNTKAQTNLFSGIQDKDVKILTKGDHNQFDDRYGIYGTDLQWLDRSHIIGRVNFMLPYLGYATIIITNYPIVKYIVIGVLILLVLSNKE
ncbi:predicted protein [Naegleria gruberi]|uniref:Signal peptidase complex catalytic subunit SEC11 n=1 Tax=Naegleria gruberi TaxID=5762 RepID=D2VTM3_NAEGR|nr:uncharacterized protein NAEGRDRAFT_72354 [Naegleria gruberi]EFC39957.1 predicted protein [Naegleria gruberi]|eukprot:XP_002672701.1 predicted protein [Naegleria gruberi strain NEG-M]